MGKYFGTDGFRGRAGVDLNAEHAFKIGRFLGWYYGVHRNNENARIVIGKDTRRSSYTFESALASGITASGSDADVSARVPPSSPIPRRPPQRVTDCCTP